MQTFRYFMRRNMQLVYGTHAGNLRLTQHKTRNTQRGLLPNIFAVMATRLQNLCRFGLTREPNRIISSVVETRTLITVNFKMFVLCTPNNCFKCALQTLKLWAPLF